MAVAPKLTPQRFSPHLMSLAAARGVVAKALGSIKLAELWIREKVAADKIGWDAHAIRPEGESIGNSWWHQDTTKFDWADSTATVLNWPRRPPDWPIGPERVEVLGIGLVKKDIVQELRRTPGRGGEAAPKPDVSAAAPSQNKGGRPEVWDWLGLVAIKGEEEKAKGRSVRFNSRKEGEEWIAVNVRRLYGRRKQPPRSSTVKRAIKRLQLDVVLGFPKPPVT